MSTYREFVYMVNDELKLSNGDSFFTEEHIIFLLNKYRANLLYLKYIALKVFSLFDDTNELEICIDLELEDTGDCSSPLLKSVLKIPSTLDIGSLKVNLLDEFSGEIALVSKRRLRYVGHNYYLQNIIYAAKGDDGYLYLKSANPQAYYLEKVKVKGAFENPDEAAKYSCDENGDSTGICDPLDAEFPIEDSLAPAVILAVVKELANATISPQDSANNSADDLANLAYWIRKNLKSNIQKKIDGA